MKNIEISDIQIKYFSASGGKGNSEGIYHKKILPFLSVVQSVQGSYDIKLGNSKFFQTGEEGVFIAPANVTQEIIHHNGVDEIMENQWVFIDAVVNGEQRFDELFSFPIILDKKYGEEVKILISRIRFSKNYFEKIQAVYRILEILYEVGTKNEKIDPVKTKIENFVAERYAEELKACDLADFLYCSVPQVYRYTKKYYNLSPANYINEIRLQKAERLLLTTKKTVTEIALSVGFSDTSYFTKLFKKHYSQSPLLYRKNTLSD